MNGMLVGGSLGIYESNQFTELETYYCDSCGGEVDGEVFEWDGDIFCDARCLNEATGIRYGHVSEFK